MIAVMFNYPRNCGKQLGDQHHIFSMSKEGPQGAFVNPGGHVHETLTLYRAKNLRLVGRPSTEYRYTTSLHQQLKVVLNTKDL